LEDHQIIALFQQRSENAIVALKEKFSRYCYQIAWNILENEQDVEEVLSDLWLQVWNAIPPRKPYALRSFLAKITQNLAFDRYRKETAIKRGGEQLRLVMEELDDCIPDNQSPEKIFDAKQLSFLIHSFVRRLSDRDRSIFLRRYFYVNSTAEIAAMYLIKESCVLTVLSRTRKKLKVYLRKEGYDL